MGHTFNTYNLLLTIAITPLCPTPWLLSNSILPCTINQNWRSSYLKMLNILDLIFLSLAFFVTFTGFLINNFEKHVPVFIIKSYRYGSFAYQGSGANYLQVIEIPKAFYRHFYLFSSIFSAITLVYSVLVYFFDYNVNSIIVFVLRLLLEQDEPASKIFGFT